MTQEQYDEVVEIIGEDSWGLLKLDLMAQHEPEKVDKLIEEGDLLDFLMEFAVQCDNAVARLMEEGLSATEAAAEQERLIEAAYPQK